MRDQRVDQGAGPVPGSRMHDQILGLVDDNNVVVLIDDLERDRLRRRFSRLRCGDIEQDRGGGIDAMVRIADRVAIDRHGAILDQRLEPAARQFGDMAREHAVEPFAGVSLGSNDRFLRHGKRHAQNIR